MDEEEENDYSCYASVADQFLMSFMNKTPNKKTDAHYEDWHENVNEKI